MLKYLCGDNMLYDILLSDDVVFSINNNIDYLLEIIPELNSIIDFPHNNPQHHLDVWNHTLLALSLSKKDFDIRLVLLLHDIGKAYSYQDGEIRHFKGHPSVSATMAQSILKRLEFSDDYINKICYLILNHDSPICDKQIHDNYDLVLKLYEIQRCDALAHNPNNLDKRKQYLDYIKRKILNDTRK